MGFFDSKSKQESSMRYDNPMLQDYASVYMGAAPWGFASLDPDAALAAMGKGATIGGKDLSGTGFKQHLKDMSAEERKQAEASQDALSRIVERQKSGQFLTPQETEFINNSLDQAFASSRNIAYKDWEKGAQSLAGRQGLRTSDTPVAQPAMNALRDMELEFSSQRAGAGLEATMKMSAQQNMFDSELMNSLNSLQFNRWNARQGYLFGSGMQGASQIGYNSQSNSTVTKGMSGYEQFMGGLDMANGVFDFGKKLGGPLMAMGSMPSAPGAGAGNFGSMSPGGMFGRTP